MAYTPAEHAALCSNPVGITGARSGMTSTAASSGVDLDSVQVHYGSSRPAEIGAAAYAQGSSIHVAPGGEAHLPHEAWHVAQQTGAFRRPPGT